MATGYYLTLPDAEKLRYREKIEIFSKKVYCAGIDPYEMTSDEFVDDVSLWPPIEHGCIYSYLINTVGQYIMESLQAYKSLEAYNYYIRLQKF